jgi:hypothetical protein
MATVVVGGDDVEGHLFGVAADLTHDDVSAGGNVGAE